MCVARRRVRITVKPPEEPALDFPSGEQFRRASAKQRFEWAQLRCWAAVIFDDARALAGWRQLLRQARLDLAAEKLLLVVPSPGGARPLARSH